MGKRRRTDDSAPAREPAEPFHQAFSALASLRDQLPAGEAAAEPSAPPPPAAASPGSTKVVVRRERVGRKGKTVTRISGLDGDLAEWARRMKQELGCGGSVDAQDVLLAGDLGDRVARWLAGAGVGKVVRGN